MKLYSKVLIGILVSTCILMFSNSSLAQLNGTYTIGGTTPDYANFTTAVSALTSSGINGPVIFNVRNGVYNEQVSIGVISGSSAINTVTFQSETGDSNAVTMTYAPTVSNNY
ncbi:MAG: hypothetical protein CVU05_04100, partial [Bacteroidetes bacterium HGW-Bacteroidetes-21]